MKNRKKISVSEIPSGIISGFYIEIYSNNEAVLTGDCEIGELGETMLKIKNNEHTISFVGENLKIINYSSSGIRINGRIDQVIFDKKE